MTHGGLTRMSWWTRAADDGGAGGGGTSTDPAAGPAVDGPAGSDGDSFPTAGDPAAQGEGASAGADGAGGGSSGGTPSPAPAKPTPADWRDRRIATLTARLREAEQRAPEVAPTVADPAAATPDIDRLANERAGQIAAQAEFTRRCNETALAGRGAFGEAQFNSRVQALQTLVDLQSPADVGAFNQFLDAAIETGEGPRLLHNLGADLNEASRIMALSPARMGIELAKLAGRPAEVSNAPRPVTPVGSAGRSHDRIDPTDPARADGLTTAEWMRRREEQVAATAKSRAA